MDGRIWVESEGVGKGSAFHFTARFSVEESPVIGIVPEPSESLRGLSVLVVDDNATHRYILETTLKNWQMEPTGVDSGEAALEAMKEAASTGNPFSLVLLDAMMPGMDGFMVGEEIKRNTNLIGTTVIMLASAGQPSDADYCRNLGISAYLTKPVKQSDLLGAILTAFGRKSSETLQTSLITRHSLRETQSSIRILLAEDNEINRQFAIRLLQKQGYTAVIARNGKEVLATLEKDPNIDLILMDVEMPEMDGLQATRLIREKERDTGEHVPIIATTAYAMKRDRERFLEAGMDGYISKPIKSQELLQIIAEMAPMAPEGESEIASEAEAAPSDAVKSRPVFNKKEALDIVQGDTAWLCEMIQKFLKKSDTMLSGIRAALDQADSDALRKTAHTLKGTLRNFAAHAAVEVAAALEGMGRNEELGGAEEPFGALQEEISRLKDEMEAFVKTA